MQSENNRSTAIKITSLKMWKRKKPISKTIHIASMQEGTREEDVLQENLKDVMQS